ncbi:hypothetical protein XfCFBP8356_008710 [Xylella fastidiosa subsp. sandyi]|uniref:DNA transfer protein n=1 Tax=Xylella fastidiosa subsp. fastidiosa TaxID=644356 RepID=A0AAJ5R395_XYLFS|nr:hypothetical protein [Xylella fastidiosa]KQH73606.1 hypothetical protein AOT81_07330 [Xylella fastidiosa]RWA43707.1 hypothetical protein XfCFBP8356_10265 [Xylella fastidiosa subsp. sandyi]WCF29068.1 hypothetical protein OK117_04165 [Xylella fastidiosa subsp. fastidiosa]WNY20070.1 hypothetical protein RO839_05570 [Xylella fastidiosa]WNY22364.1 hypothetical protein RO838_05585 [Xylella fastidiosa]
MWSALIPGAASLIGSLIQGNAARRAGNAQARASQEAIAEQQRQYNQARQDQLPWLTAGQNALTGQQAVLSGDYSGFEKAPDYTYALDQGLQGLDRSAAARGSLYSGGHQADVMKFAQGLASQNLNNYWNRLAGLSGSGQAAASQLAGLGQSYAANVGNQYNNAAAARAGAYYQTANNTTDALASLGNAFGNWYQGRNPSNTNATTYTDDYANTLAGSNANAYANNPYANNAFIRNPYRRNQWYASNQGLGG